MNKWYIVWSMILVVGLLGLSPVAQAQTESETSPVTQAEFARMMVNLLGFARYLPAMPTDQQLFALLLDYGIQPANGWQASEIVTRAVLAQVVVQGLRRAEEVENSDDPQSWIDFLESIGVSLDTVDDAVSSLVSLTDPETSRASGVTDPMMRVHFLVNDGADAGDSHTEPHQQPLTRADIDRILQEAARRREARTPATPD